MLSFCEVIVLKNQYAIRESLSAEDIKVLRERMGLSQNEFSRFLSVSKRTVERWETSKKPITGAIVTLFEILQREPELEKNFRLPGKKLKLRLIYMYDSMVCTIIDVDELERVVEIRNYTKNPLMRAFGVNTEPTFEDYEEFLESRCFPKTRDKLKLELKRLDVPFYDPILIIEKTEGRMAEDRFWIRIER
ncbi:MAG: helix-turn-helix domain-containing protein [Eubacterium sp.]|nr:helix-turn-helix domain-containing protein [Eubacterium sp.]MCR5292090.1 helix-turn-helix domain-containing protein [Eubacterium sp.]